MPAFVYGVPGVPGAPVQMTAQAMQQPGLIYQPAGGQGYLPVVQAYPLPPGGVPHAQVAGPAAADAAEGPDVPRIAESPVSAMPIVSAIPIPAVPAAPVPPPMATVGVQTGTVGVQTGMDSAPAETTPAAAGADSVDHGWDQPRGLLTPPLSLNVRRDARVDVREVQDPPPLVAQSCNVLAVMGLALDAKAGDLTEIVERRFSCKVLAHFGLWNKAAVLFEVTPAVSLRRGERIVIDDRGSFVMSSEKPMLRPAPPCTVVNLRYYVMDPSLDYAGTEEQHQALRCLTRRNWERDGLGGRKETVQELWKIFSNSGGASWIWCRCPHKPFKVAELWTNKRRRYYAQLFFEFRSAEDAEEAVNAVDAKAASLGALRGVFRADFATTEGQEEARVPNPNQAF